VFAYSEVRGKSVLCAVRNWILAEEGNLIPDHVMSAIYH